MKAQILRYLVGYELGSLTEGDMDNFMILLRELVVKYDMVPKPYAEPTPPSSTPGRIYY